MPPPLPLQTTDGFSGLNGGWDTPGTGMNFLVHNMCRLPGSDGTWMVVEGGMGVVTQRLAAAARHAGASIHTGQAASRWASLGGARAGAAAGSGQGVPHAPAAALLVRPDPSASTSPSLRRLRGWLSWGPRQSFPPHRTASHQCLHRSAAAAVQHPAGGQGRGGHRDGRWAGGAGKGGGGQRRPLPPAHAGRRRRLPARLQRSPGRHEEGRYHHEGNRNCRYHLPPCFTTRLQSSRACIPAPCTSPALACCAAMPCCPQVNLALKGLPTFACLPEDRGQHRTTTHLLPGDEGSVLAGVQQAFADVQQGRLPEFPTIEIYWQTTVDPGLTGGAVVRLLPQPALLQNEQVDCICFATLGVNGQWPPSGYVVCASASRPMIHASRHALLAQMRRGGTARRCLCSGCRMRWRAAAAGRRRRRGMCGTCWACWTASPPVRRGPRARCRSPSSSSLLTPLVSPTTLPPLSSMQSVLCVLRSSFLPLNAPPSLQAPATSWWTPSP